MRTILYQGKPREEGNWLALTPEFVGPVKEIGYEVRELVTREEVEQAKAGSFNAGVERAALLVEAKRPELAKMIRALKVQS